MAVIACGKCRTQYDASSLAPGSRFQCSKCGAPVQYGGAPTARASATGGPRASVRGRGPGKASATTSTRSTSSARRGPGGPRPGMPGRGGGRAGGPAPGSAGPYAAGGGRDYAMPAKKSSAGLMVGIGIGVAVLLVIVIVVATSGSGPSKSHAEIIAKIEAFNPQSPTLLTEQELEEAAAASGYITDSDKKRVYQHNLQQAQAHARNSKQNAINEEINRSVAAARQEVERVAAAFWDALKAKNLAAAALIDAQAYHANVAGRGGQMTKGVPWKAPGTYSGFDMTKKDGKNVSSYKAAYSPQELVGVGLQHLMAYYGSEGVTLKRKLTDNGETEVSGGPPALAKLGKESDVTSQYTAVVEFTLKGADEPLGVMIAGAWGGPAKVVMLLDKTEKQAGGKILLERLQSGDGVDPDRIPGAGAEPRGRTTEPSGAGSSADPEPQDPEPAPSDNPNFPTPPTWQKQAATDTGVQPIADNLLAAVKDVLHGNSGVKHIKALTIADNREKVRVLGACIDVLLNASRQGARKEDAVRQPVSELIVGGFADWVVPREWIEYLTYERNITSAMEMAWRYTQAYDVLKAWVDGK